jgi:NitT/TauT family transport system substrate-binding protein
MRTQGLEPDDAELLVTDWGAKQPMFLEGDVPLMSTYTTNEVAMIEVDLDRELNVWMLADYGFNILAHGIVTSEKYEADNPAVVRGINRAVARAAAWTVENPEEAAGRSAALFADVLGDGDLISEEVVLRQVEETIKLYHTPNTLDKPCGWIAEADAERTISLLFDNGAIENRDPVSEYYTNDYIDSDISCPIP